MGSLQMGWAEVAEGWQAGIACTGGVHLFVYRGGTLLGVGLKIEDGERGGISWRPPHSASRNAREAGSSRAGGPPGLRWAALSIDPTNLC